MIENILLDIDGVCNTFQHHVFNCLGLLYPDDSWYPVDCGWDIVAAANRLAGYERFTATTSGLRSRETCGLVCRRRQSFHRSLHGLRMVLAKRTYIFCQVRHSVRIRWLGSWSGFNGMHRHGCNVSS